MEYLFASAIGEGIWLLFFFLRGDLRHEMLVMSIFATPLAVFDLFFVPSYWQPHTFFTIPIGIESFIYSFSLGGICAVVYAEVSRKTVLKIKSYHKPLSLFAIFLIVPLFFVLSFLKFPNVMISLYMALLFGTGLTWYVRHDLIKSSLVGAMVFGGIYFVSLSLWISLFPQVKDWFVLEGLPRIFIVNAPLYEVLFGILFAAYWGNLYELVFGYKLTSKK